MCDGRTWKHNSWKYEPKKNPTKPLKCLIKLGNTQLSPKNYFMKHGNK
jgi:hypothetical protein